MPGLRTATSMPTAVVGSSAVSRTSWGAVWFADATSTRAATLSTKATMPRAMASRAESRRRPKIMRRSSPTMHATVPADRSGIVTAKTFMPNGPWFSAYREMFSTTVTV